MFFPARHRWNGFVWENGDVWRWAGAVAWHAAKDKYGRGKITIQDFEKNFDDEAVVAFFESMEVSAMDAWTLFLTLDVDGDHTVGWQVNQLQDAPGPCSMFGQSDSIHILLVSSAHISHGQKALSARVKQVNLPSFQVCYDFNSKSFCRCWWVCGTMCFGGIVEFAPWSAAVWKAGR